MMRNLTVALCLLILFACGSKPPRFEPPGIKLVDLTVVPEDAGFDLRVRLSNPVPRSMPIGKVQFEKLVRATNPFTLAELLMLLLITYVPFFTLFVPRVTDFL